MKDGNDLSGYAEIYQPYVLELYTKNVMNKKDMKCA